MRLELVSINVGKPTVIRYGGREIVSAIIKHPVNSRVALASEPLQGDEQADRVHHGGADKAICAYFIDHYPHWEKTFGKPLHPGAFGENFTLRGANENDIRIGDVFRLGEAKLQVTQPRVPCYKLAARHERSSLEAEVLDTGYTGFYFAIIAPGSAAAGDRLVLETPHPAGVTVTEANRIMHKDKTDAAGLKRLLGVEALAESWRQQLSKRLL
ncbi:MOSC domain-containing protein [Paenibacillus sp.]|uniref:MOSC domain-containing protein n=1 Tax=Paenibacillus sp. TaxID=58172 RepID=UPI002D289A7E|nr:MOSC domain-containing protein [Paenibacillus sp.]HZG84430.1 MOSC domain-containing protein [Paenibacillus sp.]